ncbi:hypothetical protein I8752_11175 [Nostocaceae cyanobacterium CENA369]|uniref:Uncharacterized protein n=1 Tax=Dendronalium phyllosphericum CENA369 TaxID=1725256 RepID=A0A8J7I2M1_9NOST|nr:hypothetical protein [Dendronalium phyllosphericum]MBH8573565.1 hypothetical protein [Dendronalium phyllosphericum CENA369]
MTLLGIDRPLDITQVKLWDERDLSTSSRRREQLEILLCQKVQKGEDPALCEQVLNYLYFSIYQHKLNCIAVQKEKEKSVFASVQQVFIISFAILGMFAFLAAASNKSVVRLPTVERSSPPAIQRQAN